MLCETFVEVPRHSGGVYRASGWIRVRTTKGRALYDRPIKADKPKKDIRLRPLQKNWKRTLNCLTLRPQGRQSALTAGRR